MTTTTAGLARGRTLASFILLSTLAGIGVGLAKVTTALYAISLQASPLQLGLIAGADLKRGCAMCPLDA